MKLLGVPAEQLALCFLITTALTVIFFLPAISDFGHVLLGKEDIQFFMWLFWHYGQSVVHGTDPLYAAEIGYPYGLSLTASSIAPLQGALYLLLPAAWGAFGSITFLQVLSFILGGLFSFALAYRFTKSFMPSLTGSFVFDFSAFHFEKALHHLNYSMAMPFLALFFLCYYEAMDRKPMDRRHLWLALALLLLALNELTIAVMAGFVIFIDIFIRYARESEIRITPRNILVLGGAVALSLLIFELAAAAQFPVLFVYTVPGAVFLATCIFLVLGADNLVRREAAEGSFVSMAVCAIPALGYGALLALHGSYAFTPDSAVADALQYPAPVEYLLLPSQLQQVSHLGLFQGLPTATDRADVYLGPALILLLFASWLIHGASGEEKRARGLGLLCLLFSFPFIIAGSSPLIVSPFLAAPLFPLLGFLRVPSRFMLFALLFASIAAALLCARLISPRKNGTLMAAGLAILLLASAWPALGSFAYEPHVPQFFLNLSGPSNASIFLYPDLDYYTLLQEDYYQTLHGHDMSYGTLSRFPEGTNQLFALYYMDNVTPGDVVRVVRSLGYDYVVVQKLRCDSNPGCFNGDFVPIPASRLDWIRKGMEEAFGNETYEDGSIIVYDAKAGG